ncbi:hypothetical protein Leryth_005595, partial [Lithospermum erythrorhizon]
NKISLEQSNVQNAEKEENYYGDSDSSSVCSDEASNYSEEQEFVSKVHTTLERTRRNSHKRYQVARKNNLWRKKGETKVDKKIRVLQQLIPNCPNVDNDCVLDEAIVYIKNLQNQLQFISSSSALAIGMYTSRIQTLPLPNIMHQLYASSIFRDDIFSSFRSFVGGRTQMPPSEMLIQQPSQMLNSLSSASFSAYGSLMPFPST